MYRAAATYSVLECVALCLARAVLNPSRLVASETKTGSWFHWRVDRG